MLKGNRDRQVQDASVQAKWREKSIKLIGNVSGEEREHSANVAHARYLKEYVSELTQKFALAYTYLRAQGSFLVKIPVDKIAIFFGGDPTLAVHSRAARMTNNLTNHVFSSVIFETGSMRKWIRLTADWPFCDVIWPLVWRDWGWRIAEFGVCKFQLEIVLGSISILSTEFCRKLT